MAIITKPVSIDKGTENVITLNKADLASDTKVVADSYFSVQNNWNKIFITYKTPEGNQVNDIVFDASETSPTGSFNPSLKGRDTWEVQSITILDFDGGSLKLLRGDLTVGDFDILLGTILVAYSQVLKDNNITLSGSDLIATTSDAGGFGSGAFHEHGFPFASGKYYTEIEKLAGGGISVQLAFKVFDTVPTIFGGGSGSSPAYPNTSGQETSAMVFMASSQLLYSVGANTTSVVNSNMLSFGIGDVRGIAVDLDNKLLYVHTNGVWDNGADPVEGTGGLDISLSTGIFNGAVNMNNCYFDTCMLLGGSTQKTITPVYLPLGYTNV